MGSLTSAQESGNTHTHAHSQSAFCLMFISWELHSGAARSDKISFNSLSALFTRGEEAEELGGGEAASSADTLQPTAATA